MFLLKRLEGMQETLSSDDDWNLWWKEKFDNYDFLEGQTFPNVLEVGCGPHTNIKFILPRINFKKVFMEDPLIQFYTCHIFAEAKNNLETLKNLLLGRKNKHNYIINLFSNTKHSVDLSSSTLEDLPYHDEIMDMIICINVLDHVNDYDKCMSEINRVLRKGGMLILGKIYQMQKIYKIALNLILI